MIASSDDIGEDAALYLAGASTDAERAAFEARLDRGDPAAFEAVAALAPAADALARLVPPKEPPPRSRGRLLAALTRAPVVTRLEEGVWMSDGVPGVEVKRLRHDRDAGRHSVLIRLAPGACVPAHRHHGVEECLVLAGDVRGGEEVFTTGDYLVFAPRSRHSELSSKDGCLLLIVADERDA